MLFSSSALLCVEFFFSVCFVLQQLSSYNNKNSSNNFFFASRQQRTNVMEKSHMEGYVLDEKFFPQFFLLLSVTTCDFSGGFSWTRDEFYYLLDRNLKFGQKKILVDFFLNFFKILCGNFLIFNTRSNFFLKHLGNFFSKTSIFLQKLNFLSNLKVSRQKLLHFCMHPAHHSFIPFKKWIIKGIFQMSITFEM